MSRIDDYLAEAAAFSREHRRPWVTLSYAQSLDGSLSAAPGERTRLSGDESRRLTHQLRAAHQAILVGVGTVQADDPLLTVRYAQGPDPRPVILDGQLRAPLQARIFHKQDNQPWVLCGPDASTAQRTVFEELGVRIIQTETTPNGRLDLHSALNRLYENGIVTLMVEGGAQVIRSFLEAGLVELLVITIAPRWLNGLNATEGLAFPLPQLRDVVWEPYGSDAVLWARL